MPKSSLTITDNRTGKQYEIPVTDGAIRAVDLRQIKVSDDDFGLLAYDPGFINTASCRSAISFIDGARGILRYRGLPDRAARRAQHVPRDGLPPVARGTATAAALETWVQEITHHTFIHENIKKFIDGFHHDAHPMGMFVSTVAALSTFYPDAKRILDEHGRARTDHPAHREGSRRSPPSPIGIRSGCRTSYPDNDLGYSGQLPQHDVQDDGSEVRARTRRCSERST